MDYRGVTDLSAVKGVTGALLLDPDDFVVNDPEAATIVANLATANVTIMTTAAGGGGNGDISINSPINWTSANSFTASAYRHVNVNADITNTGGAAVTLYADNSGTGTGTVSFGVGTQVSTSGTVSIFYNPSGNDNSTVNAFSYSVPTNYAGNVAGGATLRSYMLVNTVYDLQNIQNNLAGTYALGGNIDASVTSGWNSGAGFVPIGSGTQFTGTFDGQNHVVSNLTVYRPGTNYVALIGTVGSTGAIQNLNLTGANITGNQYVAGLVGENFGLVTNSSSAGAVTSTATSFSFVGGLVGNNQGTITFSYAAGSVTGSDRVGGLVGGNYPDRFIGNSHADVTVTGSAFWVGGLVGFNDGTIVQSYATGNVSGNSEVGGLVGYNWSDMSGPFASITGSYATGDVSGNFNVGGLVGYHLPRSVLDTSYATGMVTGGNNVGGLVGWKSRAGFELTRDRHSERHGEYHWRPSRLERCRQQYFELVRHRQRHGDVDVYRRPRRIYWPRHHHHGVLRHRERQRPRRQRQRPAIRRWPAW